MSSPDPTPGTEIPLPKPDRTGSEPLERTLDNRRSRRAIDPGSIPVSAVSQLLWAGQGRNHSDGFRTAPSAGATYPLVLRVVVAEDGVKELSGGVYRYRPDTHDLRFESPDPVQAELSAAAYDQEWVAAAPIDIVIAGIEERTASEYGSRAGDLYVPMEAGHVGQNLHLQAEALGLATVPVGGFRDEAVAEALDLTEARPLVMYPVGHRPDE